MKIFNESDADIAKKVRDYWKKAREFQKDWRGDAEEDFNFAASIQWDEDDRVKMEAEKRPMVTFNRCNVILSAILGMEANQRNQTAYYPRENSDSGLGEAVTAIADWVQEYGEIDQEDSQAFEDMLTCGMGWTETRMDYDTDMDGQIIREIVPVFEMAWDWNARKRNLTDADWVGRGKKMTIEEIKELWPSAEDVISEDMTDSEDDAKINVVNPSQSYNQDKSQSDSIKKGTVVQCQWYEKEMILRVVQPATGKIVELPDKKELRKKLDESGMQYVKQPKRTYYQAFVVGNTLLEKRVSPSQTGFTLRCMTGKQDKVHNEFYGLMRLMKDPQRWANKFLSSFMDIINSNSKGGVMHETGAFTDVAKAQEGWAQADSMIEVSPGALSGGRIQPKPDVKYPQAIDRLLQFAISSVYDVSGVNLEMLGMVDRDQAGVVEETRKKAAYTILAPFFDSLRSYRKEAGITLLEYIKNYIPESRYMEVLEPALQQYAPMIKQVDLRQMNIVVAESPQSDNNKQFVWAFAAQIVPQLLKLGLPIPPSILEYTPLPKALVEDWKKAIGGGGNEQQKMMQMQQQNQQMQQMMQQMQQEMTKLKAQEQVKLLELQNKKEISAEEMQLEKTKVAIDTEARLTELQNKQSMELAKLQAEIQLEREKMMMQTEMKREEIHLDAAVKRESAKDAADVQERTAKTAQSAESKSDKSGELIAALVERLTAPKKIIRDGNGRVSGVE